MACGNLVKVLLHTKVTRYLEFKSVGGSYVYKDSKVHKVPATKTEALKSDLMGMFQKRRFANFLGFIDKYDQADTKTWDGVDITKTTMRQLFDKFSLDANTQQFCGHAIALRLDESYLDQPAKESCEAMKLYAHSVLRYGNSPYIYPVYGLGGLPEGFSRLCAIHGGTYMLNKPIAEIVYDEAGKVCGVKDTEGQIARTKMVICDPSYVPADKVKNIGRIVRCIAILSHPIPNTNDADSCQIILPALNLKGRKSDIYLSMVSYHHKICASGKYIAVISANLEGNDAKKELEPALNLLGKIDETFFWVSDNLVPLDNNGHDGVFVTASYDATSHFETATDEVIELYQKIMGEPIDLTIAPDLDADQE